KSPRPLTKLHLQPINPSTSPNELNTTLTPHSMIHGDAYFAYFNKIWGIPGNSNLHQIIVVSGDEMGLNTCVQGPHCRCTGYIKYHQAVRGVILADPAQTGERMSRSNWRGSTIRVPRSSVASSVRWFLFCSARKSRSALIQLARFDCVCGVQLYRSSSRAFMSHSKVHRS